MAFIIPNATDTTSGNKYAALDQAEPDSLDFEILGNDKNGVISGCAVLETSSSAIPAVIVTDGVVAINGAIYTVQGDPYLRAPAIPVNGSRFDVVIARLINVGTIPQMTLTFIQGVASIANPTYPKSVNRVRGFIPGSAAAAEYYNPDTDVILAAVYRNTNLVSITSEHIVDKRKSIQTPISYRGPEAPTSSQGEIGDLYLRTSPLSNGESGLYIKRGSTEWNQLASVPIDPGVPIGTVITWVAPNNPNTSVWAECNGAEISRATYGLLFDVLRAGDGSLPYGSGDNTTTFNLPDFRGMFMAGLPSAGASLGVAEGNLNNQVVLTEPQVPGHTHGINHAHSAPVTTSPSGTHEHGSDGGSHVHAMDHGHSASVSSNGEHEHFSNYLQNANNTGPNHYLRPMDFPTDGLIKSTAPGGGGHNHNIRVGNFVGFTSPSSSGTSSVSAGVHSHTVSIPSTTDLVSASNRTISASPVNIQPRTMYVRYFIRYA